MIPHLKKPLSRRALLRGAGGIALALPFLEAMTPRRARAGNPPLPKRIVLFFTPNGFVHDSWAPTGSGTSFQLSPVLSPLEPVKNDIIVIDGLEMKRGGPGDGHQQGMAHLWTGIELLPGDAKGGDPNSPAAGFSSGPSIDQVIAKAKGLPTRPSFALAVQASDGKDAWTRMTYADANAPVDPENNPYKAFDKLFANVTDDSAAQAAVEKLRLERKTVVDAVLGDFQSLKPRLSGADVQRVDAHLAALASLQQQVSMAAPVNACKKPTLGGDPSAGVSDNDLFPTIGKLQMDVLAATLACDVTRMMSLQWGNSVSDVTFTWLGISGDGMGHHSLSHRDGEAPVRDLLNQIDNWYAQQFAYLVSALKALPEGSGSVLDNTVICWGNELAEGGPHSPDPAAFVLAGGCGGAFKTGRYLKYDKDPHNNLLVSLANAMDVPMTTFGNPDWCTGPLQGL